MLWETLNSIPNYQPTECYRAELRNARVIIRPAILGGYSCHFQEGSGHSEMVYARIETVEEAKELMASYLERHAAPIQEDGNNMVRTKATFQITSEDGNRKYTITVQEDDRMACSCPGYFHRSTCKHINSPAAQSMAAYVTRKAQYAPSKPRVRLEDLYR